MNTQPTITMIGLDNLRPFEHNARKHFAADKLTELAESLKKQGLLQAIVVRAKAGRIKGTQKTTDYEIIAGERRWRAAETAGWKEIACTVRELTDNQAMEVSMAENLHDESLTPLEQARGFQDMLGMKDGKGAPIYTVATLAERFGRDARTIQRSLQLIRLPSFAGAAVEAGTLAPTIAWIIARIPNEQAREAAAAKIIKDEMTRRQATEHIAAHYMVGLDAPPFRLDDADLVKAAGPCTSCPKMTANCADQFDSNEQKLFRKKNVCTDPSCFQGKVAAARALQIKAATAEGKTVLSDEASAKIYPNYYNGRMHYDSPYVEIAQQPESHLLKGSVKSPPSWKQIVEQAEKKTGGKVPRVLIAAPDGTLRECVNKRLVVAAVEQSGEKIFRPEREDSSSGSRSGPMTPAEKKKRAKLIADNKANRVANVTTLANALDRLKGVTSVDAASVTIVAMTAAHSDWRIKSQLREAREQIGLTVPAGFGEGGSVGLWAKLKPEDALRWAAAAIARAQAAAGEQMASEPSDELVMLAGKHKVAAPPAAKPKPASKAGKGGAKK